MSLRLIIGRAGTGKSLLCLKEITERIKPDSHEPLILLVPEQATFHMEKKLLEYGKLGGTINAQVLSFQRMSWRILQETGGIQLPPIDEVGKSLIIRSILEKNRSGIKFFNRVLERPGFIEILAQSISEFKAYGINPESLSLCLSQLGEQDENLALKLQDISLIYKEYERYLKERYLDLDDNLTILARNIHKAQILSKAEIWVDGFNGFTPQEYMILKELLIYAPKIHITLCLDKEHTGLKMDEHELFYPSWDTYQHLLGIASEVGCVLEDKVFLAATPPWRFVNNEELAYIERSLVLNNDTYKGAVKSVRLVTAANIRAEIEGIAREIIRLSRDEDYRYQDVAVITRDLEPYEKLLPSIFSSYGIPFFLDKKRALQHHPLLDLTKGALEIAEKGWNYEPIFRYLKTDLANISRQESDVLENYCLAHGIRKGRWNDGKPWNYRRNLTISQENAAQITLEEERLLARINKARNKVVDILDRFIKSIEKAQKGRDYALSLYNLYEDLAIARKLEYWSQAAERNGLLEEGQIHNQVWNKMMELLDQVAEVLGNEELSIGEFNKTIEAGLDCIELGLIPPCLDQVMVGSVDRSRNPDLKAVFIIGAVEGVFPSRGSEDGLINDEERRRLAELDVVLAPSCTARIFSEQFYVYSALTRASCILWLCCPLADNEGKALAPSPLLNSISKLFLDWKELNIFWAQEPNGDDDLEYLAHPGPAIGYLAVGLRRMIEGKEIHPFWGYVYNWYLGKEKWQTPLKNVVQGLFEENNKERLTTEQSRKLYGAGFNKKGHIFHTSVSRLEKHKACPFSHFITYGLKLKEREEYKLKSPDLGQFFHAALEGVYGELHQKGRTLKELGTQEIIALVDTVVDYLVPLLSNELLLSTARHRYLTGKLKRTVLRAVKVLKEHERRGTFRPLGVEISFGSSGSLPGLEITLSDGTVVILQGRIDRIDSASDEKGSYLRVIDYKSGTPTLSLMEIYYGLKLQLLAYLDVVMTNAPQLVQKGNALPGGILYFRIKDPFVAGKGPLESNEVESMILKQLKMKGFLLKDQDVIKLMDSEIDGSSDILPAAWSEKSGLYNKGDNLLTYEEFQILRKYMENVLKDIGEEIITGNIAIRPYSYKGRKPCSYCLYSAICRFDTLIPGNNYLTLKNKDIPEIWNELGLAREEHHE